MNILDENVPESQLRLLRKRRVRVQQIGQEVGRKGMKDDEIIRRLCHDGYCLVHLDVEEEMVAEYCSSDPPAPCFELQSQADGPSHSSLASGIDGVVRARGARRPSLVEMRQKVGGGLRRLDFPIRENHGTATSFRCFGSWMDVAATQSRLAPESASCGSSIRYMSLSRS